MDGEESWDSPFEWRNNVSSQIISSMSIDQNLLTKSYAQQVKGVENENCGKFDIETLINIPYNRNPNQPIRESSCAVAVSTNAVIKAEDVPAISKVMSPKHLPSQTKEEHVDAKAASAETLPSPAKTNQLDKNVISQKKLPSQVKEEKNIENTITKAENTAEPVNPIAELKHLARRLSASDDEPPFNFQGMLRKTNYQRQSLKRSVKNIKARRSSQQDESVVETNTKENSSKSNSIATSNNAKENKNKKEERRNNDVDNRKLMSMEIAPGIFLEGLMADL